MLSLLEEGEGMGRQGMVEALVFVTVVLSLSAVSRDSVMIGCKFQRASSGGV